MSCGEAMVGPDSENWLEAIKSERGSIDENKVQTLEELLDGRKAVRYMWILRRRRTWMGMSPSMKLDLWRRVSHKFKGLTTMSFSHP